MKKFLSTHWFAILITLAVLSFITSVVLRLLTPEITIVDVAPSQLTTKNFDSSKPNLSRIKYSGPGIVAPESVKIIATTTNTLESSGYINGLISKLNLSPSASTTTWENSEWRLSYIKSPGYYELILKEEDVTPAIISKEKSITVAQQFVTETLGFGTMRPVENDITFFRGDGEFEQVHEFKAHIMLIPFSYYVDSFPVYLDYQDYAPISIMVDSNYKVHKVTFQPVQLSYSQIQETTPLSLDEALKNMNDNNEGSFITAYKEEHGLVNLTQDVTGSLKSATLEYRYDSSTRIIYPFYRFKGVLSEPSSPAFEASIITPAVKVN